MMVTLVAFCTNSHALFTGPHPPPHEYGHDMQGRAGRLVFELHVICHSHVLRLMLMLRKICHHFIFRGGVGHNLRRPCIVW